MEDTKKLARIAIIEPFQLRFARGIERFTWALATHMARRGVLVDVLTWKWPEPRDWGAIPPGVAIKQVPDFRYYRAWASVPYYVTWLANGNYDWVLVYFSGYGEGAALRILEAIRPQRCCVVLQYPCEQVPLRYREFERSGVARRADRMIAASSYVARGARDRFHRACDVIGNGVDTSVFCPSRELRVATRQKLGLDASAPVLISLAALEERKGLHWIIRALPLLLDEFPSLRYWVFGEGDYRGTLEAEVRDLGLEKHVWMPGATADVVPYLASADVGCLLSQGEAFGIALLEYMAMELPVVTSRRPPFDELVQPSWGRMIDEGDTQQIARTLRDLLRDPLRRCSMGRAGRQHVLENYTWDRIADEYLRVLAPQGQAAHLCA
jgi:glycosyltransferase involved in cell wall biosynthesis